jgi:hypothetical protein
MKTVDRQENRERVQEGIELRVVLREVRRPTMRDFRSRNVENFECIVRTFLGGDLENR